MSPTTVPAPLLPAQAPTPFADLDAEPERGDFAIPAEGLTDGERLRALDRMDGYLTRKRRHLVGYQATQELAGSALDLARFMLSNINNLGDPFQSGGYKPNTKVVERAVLDYYARLWHAGPSYDPADPESYWGYMLSMGSTEGNMYALWNARDYLTRPGAPRPVAFYSEDTHYSFAKAVRVLGVDTFAAVGAADYPGECPLGGDWPAEVPSMPGPSGRSWDGSGAVDAEALAVLVEFFAAKGHPIFVNFNLGSTFKGAHDDVRGACELLLPVFERHGLLPGAGDDARRGFWIHVDGALGAGYAPFLRMAAADPAFGWTPEAELSEFDFGLTLPTRGSGEAREVDMVASIAMSGHKWAGVPWPCGVFMTKTKYQLEPPTQPEYIGAPDSTFAGSRNGFSPLVLWDHLSRLSYRDQVDRIRRSQELAEYLESGLRELERETGAELWPARTPGAITVRFRKPSPALVAKWSLSSENVLTTPGDPAGLRGYVHVFLMPSVDRSKLDALLADLARDPAILGAE
ncbi:PLP-dependent aminotransferase family protein [Kitasatospora purpeofusca]|uniref:histidine decarboxylase n=1 Tax=Kitasatospora purpeofusca TaxID=67352 RepID=UPI0037F6B0D8